jgi:hypothetical protein
MTISGVEPAERSLSFVTWGLAALGLTAILAALPALRADRAAAQQTSTAESDLGMVSKPIAFAVRISKNAADNLKIKGLLASDEDHKALMGLVKASYPSADVTDRVKISNGAKTDFKLGGISFALKALSFLDSGTASVDEHGVTLWGTPESASGYAEFKSFVATPPTGIVIKDNQVSQPPTSPSWRAEVGQGKVRLTGTVADSSDKKELEATVQNLFSGLEIVDETAVVAGSSDSWMQAAIHSLQVLRLLDSGFVELGDHKIQLYGQASDESKLRKIDLLADSYPSGFSLDTRVSAPARASMIGFPSASAAERSPMQTLGGVPEFASVPAE